MQRQKKAKIQNICFLKEAKEIMCLITNLVMIGDL
jgi:hypothetical protein